MIELKNRTVDDYGNVVFRVKDLYPLIMRGFKVTDFLVTDSSEVQQLKRVCFELDQPDLMLKVYKAPETPLEEHLDSYRRNWMIPDEYKHINIREWILERCTRPEEVYRVNAELDVFERYELFDMLRALIYLVDTFRKNEIIWGVGRGSSVASYVLYKIGIHRVDSIAYDLDFSEFLS